MSSSGDTRVQLDLVALSHWLRGDPVYIGLGLNLRVGRPLVVSTSGSSPSGGD